MSVMRFAKLHGLGNDFVLLDLRGGGEPLPAERALQLCDRHLGVGADGILTLLPGERMLVQNADGSVPEMCGNGARCAALWIATAGGTKPAQAHVMLLTDAGSRPCVVETSDPRSGLVEVDMGVGQIRAARPPPPTRSGSQRSSGRRSAAPRTPTSSSSRATVCRPGGPRSTSAGRGSRRPAGRGRAR